MIRKVEDAIICSHIAPVIAFIVGFAIVAFATDSPRTVAQNPQPAPILDAIAGGD